jgi:hypothetical protein
MSVGGRSCLKLEKEITPLVVIDSYSDFIFARKQVLGPHERRSNLPYAALRHEVGGPRSGILRGPTPQSTDQPSQMESCQAGISNCRSRCDLKRSEFLGSEKQIPQITETTGKSKWWMELLESDSARPRQALCRHENVIVVVTNRGKTAA